MNIHKTLFISDLHLEESRPDITEQFINLLRECDHTVDALYILGDLFEVWLGDDDDAHLSRKIIQELQSATQKGLKIYFMYGNRDFLVGKRFIRETGCHLLPDEKTISLYGTPVLLLHGDTLCTNDIAYMKARKFARNPLVKFVLSCLSLSTRKKIGNKMRAKSMQHTSSVAIEIMDVTPHEVDRVMQKHAVSHLIHGHTHKPAFHHFSIGNSSAIRIVLPAWHDKGRVLVWDEHGNQSLQDL